MNNESQTVAQLRAIPVGEKRPFVGVYLLKKLALKKAKNGNDFLSLELGDNSGSFSANCWSDSPAYSVFEAAQEGDVVRVEGISDHYRDSFSPSLRAAKIMDETEVQQSGVLENLVKISPEDPQALWDEFQNFKNSITHVGLRNTVELAVQSCEETFRTAPAALAMHHAYRFGLLEHTVHVGRVTAALLPLYPHVNADLAMTGALLHDIGKALEYGNARAPTRTRIGRLEGHIVLGYRMVRSAMMRAKKENPDALDADTVERLEHIILSHQGELQWGAAVLASTPEALLVSLADNLDAKMAMTEQALRESDPNAEFSDFLKGLGVNLLLTPPSTSASDTEAIDENTL